MGESADSDRTGNLEQTPSGIPDHGDEAAGYRGVGDSCDAAPELRDYVGHPHARTGRVPQVSRRRSPIDPPDGSWAVIGAGGKRSAILDTLTSAGIPAVGYEKRPSVSEKSAGSEMRFDQPGQSDQSDQSGQPVPVAGAGHSELSEHFVRFNHIVIAVDEIDDIEGLAVTSRDRLTGEINTDYFAGIVVATKNTGFCGDLVDPVDAAPLQPHRVFTPHHPAVMLVGTMESGSGASPETRARTEPVDRAGVEPATGSGFESGTQARVGPATRAQADFVAAYAKLLADSPRKALSFHRHVSSGTEPSLDIRTTPGVVGEPELGEETLVGRTDDVIEEAGDVGETEVTSLLDRMLRHVADLDKIRGSEGLS